MSSIDPTIALSDRENFVELINDKLNSIPIYNLRDARTAAAALGYLIDKVVVQVEVPSSLLERIIDIRELMDDPKSLGNPSLYSRAQLRQYEQVAVEIIPAKIKELLNLSSSDIERNQEVQREPLCAAMHVESRPHHVAEKLRAAIRRDTKDHSEPLSPDKFWMLFECIYKDPTLINVLIEFLRKWPAMFIPKDIQRLPEFRPTLLEFIWQHPENFGHLPYEFRIDPEFRAVLIKGLSLHPEVFSDLPPCMKEDLDLLPALLDYLRLFPAYVTFLSEKGQRDPAIRPILLDFLREQPEFFITLSDSIQREPEIRRAANRP